VQGAERVLAHEHHLPLFIQGNSERADIRIRARELEDVGFEVTELGVARRGGRKLPGLSFDPAGCVPVGPGTFVKRRAHIPHYDGVVSAGKEPAVVAVFGMSPIGVELVEPSEPGFRHA